MNMTNLVEVTPYAVSAFGVAMMAKALHLYSESRPQTAEGNRRKLTLVLFVALAMPSLAHAAAVDLRTATESGNAIIMASPNGFSQDMFSCRSACGACVTSRDLIAYCRLAIFAPHPKVKAVDGALRRRARPQRRGSGVFPRGGDRAAIRP